LLVNTVVGFIGPEYLFDGKQIIRAGPEDHFCGKLLGLPMGCDVCYTNHAEGNPLWNSRSRQYVAKKLAAFSGLYPRRS
jgi:ethanolamine ammonia-lyase large subunit